LKAAGFRPGIPQQFAARQASQCCQCDCQKKGWGTDLMAKEAQTKIQRLCD
jgi:hypothetical protein